MRNPDTAAAAVDPALDSLLRDWGRWARSYARGGPRHCASIEGRYLPEAGSTFDDGPRALRPDERLAWHIECLWRERCPLRERLLLRAHYVTAPSRSGDAWAAHVRRHSRKLGIRAHEWPNAVGAAAALLGQHLRRWAAP